jgi:adenylate cyclase
MSERAQRRLTTIVAADVAGYSRLVGADEEGTLWALRSHRKELIDPLIEEHGGRVANTAGDSLLLEFPSVVDAVRCVVAIQEGLRRRNRDIDEEQRIQFRVGINLGDVVADGNDLLGDGVNVAARLEQGAEPGGICISGAVHDQVRDRVDFAFEDLGEQEVKNIDRPVRTWRWVPGQTSTVHDTALPAAPVSLPDKPSIAVLPFENMSSDPEQGFFGDGLAEDVITALSKIASLFVIARNSSFAYKGRATDIRQVAKELGVKYVFEGSVRAAAGRIRVTAQLIDAVDGHHLWAERYDRKVEDIFDIQDEITREIVTALRIKLSDGEQAQLMLRGTESVEAWSHAMPALDLIMNGTPSGIAEGRRLLELALAADPRYASAYALSGFTHVLEAHFGFSDNTQRSLQEGLQWVERAFELDPNLAIGHMIAGTVINLLGDSDQAMKSVFRAIELSPNDALIKMGAGRVMIDAGFPAGGEKQLREAMRLNPYPPTYYFGLLANALEMQGKDDEALELLQSAVARDPNYFSGHLRLASLLATLERIEEARHHAREAPRINPRFGRASISAYYKTSDEAVLTRFLGGLEAAGLLLD